jgi:hypothetical protein
VAKLHNPVVAVPDAPDMREKLIQSGAMPAPYSDAFRYRLFQRETSLEVKQRFIVGPDDE